MNSRHISYLLLFGFTLLISLQEVRSQGVNIGIPPMRNFSKKVYQAGTQNWDAAQDSRGVMYWANNDGLLQFDGTYWTTYPVANHTIVRAVAVAHDGRIFVGAQSELGYFSADKIGRLQYTSLVNLLPQTQRAFEDVWDIVFLGEEVFFRTNRVVFQYSGNNIKIHTPDKPLTSMFSTPDGLFVQEGNNDFLTFTNGSFHHYVNVPALESAVTGCMSWSGDTMILSSLKNGLFSMTAGRVDRWRTPHDDLLKEKRIYSAARLPNGYLALGTSLEGLIVMDHQRRILRHLTRKSGLQNNNILNVFSDSGGNAWLGLDNGIDCIDLDSPFSSVFPDGDMQATGYAATIFGNQLYLGVSNGAYVASWQSFYDPEQGPIFKRVTASDGQVWNFNIIGDELLMGHHEGAFLLENDQAHHLSDQQGAWTFVPLSDDYMLGGTYEGLALYRKEESKWVFERTLDELKESCRIMVRDEDGFVWISHPYRGVYLVSWSPDEKDELKVRFFNEANGLPSNLNNYVFQIAGKAVVATEQGVFQYHRHEDRFIPDEDFNRLLGTEHRVRYLKEDGKGNIWYVTDEEVGILLVDDFGLMKQVQKKVYPELAGKLVGGFEFIYPLDERNVIFGTEQGFIHFNADPAKNADTSLQIILCNITASGARDSLLYGGHFSGRKHPVDPPILEAGMNNLLFAYSATDFENPTLVQYRSMLEGMEEDWSAWSGETKRTYTNLGAGNYTFKVQARIKDSKASTAISYEFKIRPPWYESAPALVLYGIGVVGVFIGFIFRQRQKFESEKAQMKVLHQKKEAQHLREVEQSRTALTEIQNEKLEFEIKYKNQELASTTMHLVQKAEILLTVQEALNQILEKSNHPSVQKEIQQLLNLLNFDVKLDEDWEHFAYHFDKVHVDFLKNLRERFPQLSLNDYKLCAYLRMNLSTKEIAPLLNISVRGVEGSRYRLRKKLNLPNDANLTDFILRLPHEINSNGIPHSIVKN